MSAGPQGGSIARAPRSRAFLLWLVLVAAIDAAAYAGALPDWLRNLPGFDTLCHFVLLGVAGLAAHVLLGRRRVFRAWPLGPLVVALLSSADEAVQALSPRRSSNWSDLVANLAGITFFVAAYERRRRSSEPCVDRSGAGQAETESRIMSRDFSSGAMPTSPDPTGPAAPKPAPDRETRERPR